MRLSLAAASIITLMMLLPLTSRLPLATLMSLLYWEASVTSFAAARACRPSLLMIVTSRSAIAVAVLAQDDAVAAGLRSTLRHRLEVEVGVVVDIHQHRQVESGHH